MSDDFERFLAQALGPAERKPDRSFVVRTMAQVALEERFAGERRAIIRSTGQEMLALLAVGAGLWLLSRSPAIANLVAESPTLYLSGLLSAFASLVALFSSQTSRRNRLDFGRSFISRT